MTFEKVEKYRADHPLGFEHKPGDNYGWFKLHNPSNGHALFVMAAPSDSEWQHVSVSRRFECPNWDDMCFVKSMFWGPEDCVVQFHPPESDYVNMAKTCLHLWSWKGGEFPRPPSILVGLK